MVRHIDEIIVHCSATRPDWRDGQKTSTKVAEIKRWHVKDRGWRDIGYHFLIDRDGTVAKGRPVTSEGAHTRGRNEATIGICLLGGHASAETDDFSEHFTTAQDKALRRQLQVLRDIYPIKKISGHNEYAAKACPGFNVSRWLGTAQVAPAPVAPSTPAPSGFFAWLRKLFT